MNGQEQLDNNRMSFLGGAFKSVRRFNHYPVIPILIILVLLVIPAIFADLLAPHESRAGGLGDRLIPPMWLEGGSSEYILGTDRVGRDIFSRIIHGSRISLVISLIGIASGGILGTGLGLIAGYVGGWADAVIMRLVDIGLALPSIIFALALGVLMGPSFATVIIVVTYVLWAYYCRQIRGEVLRVKSRDFIARAKVSGASDFRIIRKHVFPNVTNTLIVLATLQVGFVIVLEATLSFLGVGIPRPTPAWGLMVADGREYITSAWWIAMFPGLAIMLTVLALNLLGDSIRDRLDPTLRQV
ncbi:MAG: ABC transporter permease [Dehalococcoidia bacterium]